MVLCVFDHACIWIGLAADCQPYQVVHQVVLCHAHMQSSGSTSSAGIARLDCVQYCMSILPALLNCFVVVGCAGLGADANQHLD